MLTRIVSMLNKLGRRNHEVRGLFPIAVSITTTTTNRSVKVISEPFPTGISGNTVRK
jgi:hypothetical protein